MSRNDTEHTTQDTDGGTHSPQSVAWTSTLFLGVDVFVLRPTAGSTQTSLCHLSVSHTLLLFTVQSGDFSASPHCKRYILTCHVLFIYLLNHVAEAAIFWQMCLTGSWLCVSGYVTADEAVIWWGVKLINRAADYKGNSTNVAYIRCIVTVI